MEFEARDDSVASDEDYVASNDGEEDGVADDGNEAKQLLYKQLTFQDQGGD